MRLFFCWIALGLNAISFASQAKSCSSFTLSHFWPHALRLEESSYQQKLAEWRTLVSISPLPASEIGHKLRGDNSALNWIALHDALITDTATASLFEVAKALSQRRLTISEQLGVWDNDISGRYRSRWLPWWDVKRIQFILPTTIPARMPAPHGWLFEQLVALNRVITEPLLLENSQIVGAIRRAEHQVYEIGYRLQGQGALRLPRSALKNHPWWGEGLLYLWKLKFPLRAVVHWQPQDRYFQLYRDQRRRGLTPVEAFADFGPLLPNDYASRVRIYLFSQYYRSALAVGALAGLAVGSVKIAEALRTGSWLGKIQAVQTMGGIAGDPEKRERAISEYESSEEGYEGVVSYYTEQIQALREQQRLQGDASGEIEKEIEFKQQQMKELMR